MKHTAVSCFFLAFLAVLLFFPNLACSCAKTGLMLWFYTLLPALLPFFIVSNLLLENDTLDYYMEKQTHFWKMIFNLSPQGAYALILGIFCGYPMGAKITADLYKKQRISKSEASYLLAFVNHPGPTFLSSFLCIGLFHNPKLIAPTYGAVYLSSFFCSLLARYFIQPKLADSSKASCKQKEISPSYPFGKQLDISIMNSFEAITRLGGYMILFSILQGTLKQFLQPFPILKYLIPGLVEMTTGVSQLLNSSWSISKTYPLSLSMIVLGGLCVTTQTKSMIANTDLSMKPYLLGKICCSTCTYCLANFLVKVI